MRTGSDYRQALRDGRQVYILGEGLVEDVTTHPATQPMVDEYVAWYDRHFDPAWQDVVLTPPDGAAERFPVGYMVPRSADDLGRMGRCFAATCFLSAGNITHTPAYGHLIALGVLHAVGIRNASAQQVANAEVYRGHIAKTGRFLTFAAGAATMGYRLRPIRRIAPRCGLRGKPTPDWLSVARSGCTPAQPTPRMCISAPTRVWIFKDIARALPSR